jgi:hypothetical protein
MGNVRKRPAKAHEQVADDEGDLPGDVRERPATSASGQSIVPGERSSVVFNDERPFHGINCSIHRRVQAPLAALRGPDSETSMPAPRRFGRACRAARVADQDGVVRRATRLPGLPADETSALYLPPSRRGSSRPEAI